MGRETVFWHSLDIARTHADRQQASFLHNVSLGLSPSLISMLPQLNDQPFGTPSSLPQHQPEDFTFHPNSKDTGNRDASSPEDKWRVQHKVQSIQKAKETS
jgi:hypothetical protein